MQKLKQFLGILLIPNGFLMLMVVVNILVGLFTYRDFGYTWDEPLFYQYGDAVGYAYSIREWFSPDFNLEKSFGPSVYDHKYYGPAYLLAGQVARRLINIFLPENNWDTWRLVNFLCFQLGVVFLYRLARRWLSGWASLAAAGLFAYQPLLWGIGFINPKDMPFMVFFVVAVVAGFEMVDRLCSLSGEGAGEAPPDSQAPWSVSLIKLRLLWLLLCGLFLASIIVLYSDPMDRWIVRFIRLMYQAPSGNVLHKVFMRLAPGAPSTPMETYADQALGLFYRLQPGLAAALGILFLAAAALILLPYFPNFLSRLEMAARSRLAWPAWHISATQETARSLVGRMLRAAFWPAVLLGGLVSIRVLGPFAGLLALGYFLLRHERRYWLGFIFYILIAAVVSLATWPFLWVNPPARFVEVLIHMANNPQILSVLFNGQVYPTNAMPGNYLPVMLGITLTEPVWLLSGVGLAIAAWYGWRGRVNRVSVLLVLAWFGLPCVYVLLRHPPMYDGFRHFLFILPPVFIFAGFCFQALLEKLPRSWITVPLIGLVLLPGLVGIERMHPYEYAYYNQFVGGVGGAFRRFETDYWLMCYKELLPQVTIPPKTGRLYVLRQPANAQLYAPAGLSILRYDPDDDQTSHGDFLLLPTRSNNDLQYHPEAPVVYQVQKNGAVFCLIKEIP